MSNLVNQAVIQGKIVKKPYKLGGRYYFSIIADNEKSSYINLFFDIETLDERIYKFVNEQPLGTIIKCTCLLRNKILQNRLIPSLECYDIRAV